MTYITFKEFLMTTSWTTEDNQRLEIMTEMMSGVMSGLMARGISTESAQRQAASTSDRCLVVANRLLDLNKEHDQTLAEPRLKCVQGLFSTTVANLIARGQHPDESLLQASRMKETFFATANSTLRALQNSRPQEEVSERREIKPFGHVLKTYQEQKNPSGPTRSRSHSFGG